MEVFIMQNGSSLFTTRTLNRAAMLIAMSVVLKAFLSIEGLFFRFTLFSAKVSTSSVLKLFFKFWIVIIV